LREPVDPAQPVMMAGDPQWNNATKRLREGIPAGTALLHQLRRIAQVSAAQCRSDEGADRNRT
jgi:LDH2 family malate/lactate/ureidoglycolate dehydrogenase